jgi:hypothetical protein
MELCLGMLEHCNGSEHLLKLMVWCLGMSEHWNASEHLLKLMGVVSGHVRALEWFGAST